MTVDPQITDPLTNDPRARGSRPQGSWARFRWQVRLRTLLLLMAACASWLAWYGNDRETLRLTAQLAVLRPLACVLRIEDPHRHAVVLRDPQWYDESIWELYLAPGSYRVCLATREVASSDFPSKYVTATLGAGRHQVEWRQVPHETGERGEVWANGQLLLSIDETLDWNSRLGSVGGNTSSVLRQASPSERLELFRRRFTQRQPDGGMATPTGPTNGVLLWIEPE
ncbi:MAG: hypothetical protein U0935_04485 [Pirellulales bacterium]